MASLGSSSSGSIERSVLDVVAVAFAGTLRRNGLALSPAETIEVRRAVALIGAVDRDALRAGLRATCAKYAHEQVAFDRGFDEFFGAARVVGKRSETATIRALFAEGLPEALDLDGDSSVARYAEYNERAAEVGDYFDTPDAEKGFNPHKDDDDISLSTSDGSLSVDTDSDTGRRGVSYTVEVDRAGASEVGELANATAGAVAGSLRWDDPAGILAWLDAYDPRRTYSDASDDELLSEAQLHRLVEAVEAFVEALAQAGIARPTTEPTEPASQTSGTRTDVERACHEVLRRMRGAPRPTVRAHRRGRLDMRATARASMHTDGVPFRLLIRTPRPERVRLLILADVSLSVRPVTAFTLRLAQTLHRRVGRCRVLAFVDRPVDVTDILLRSSGDDALAAVLACPELDLQASSDYGKVFSELAAGSNDVNNRTSVLIVGDGRSNGLDAHADQLASLRRRVHRLAWVTPEPPRYWPQASCAMPEYAPLCDGVVVARDPAELVARARDLGNALR
ncbi:VWA domain-containing protein [Antrihabitans sp. YC2-6]|uniref:MadC family VWA domain-containing protein n=1 Tax=Antrihabitans sp. YC2-6 TaxID=2799498 RepID=UPI0027DD0AFD|nr:VWA domain-containing protein [Antrihabitans sp. YC2-6]